MKAEIGSRWKACAVGLVAAVAMLVGCTGAERPEAGQGREVRRTYEYDDYGRPTRVVVPDEGARGAEQGRPAAGQERSEPR